MKYITENQYLKLIDEVNNNEYQDYIKGCQKHRSPDVFAKQYLRELGERLVAFQNKNQLNLIIPFINERFESDKTLKSYFLAMQEYCNQNNEQVSDTAKLIAEYNGMDVAYRRISAENPFYSNNEQKEQSDEGGELTSDNTEFTTARQVLAIHFLLEYCKIKRTEVDNSDIARFIQFLTGKSYKNIYDLVREPYLTKNKKFRFEDLRFIRSYFEKLGLSEVTKSINNQLDKPL